MHPREILITLCVVCALLAGIFWYANKENTSASLIHESCPGEVQTPCLSDLIVHTITEKGLDEGLTLMEDWYAAEISFRPQCTRFAQTVGEKLGAAEPDYAQLVFTEKSVSCDYRLFQGYLEVLLEKNSDAVRGGQFCTYVGLALKTIAPDATVECFRNLGRVLTRVYVASSTNPLTTARLSTDACAQAADVGEGYNRCVQGVFSELGTIESRKQTEPSQDPLELCRTQKKELQKYCYENMVKGYINTVYNGSTNDVRTLIIATEKRFKDFSAQSLTELVWVNGYQKGFHSVGLQQPAAESFIASCKLLPEDQWTSCVSGYALGLAKHGFPRKQYREVSTFCAQAINMLAIQGSWCVGRANAYLRGIYPPAVFAEACKVFKKELDFDCLATTPPQAFR